MVALTVFVAPVVSGAQPPELRVVARTQASGNVEVLDLVEGGVARTGDGLRFRVRSSTRAYVYVFAVGASGSAVLLHPIERGSGDALTQSGNTINIPEGDAFLDLDRHVGREYVVTVGARSPVRDIDSMLLAAEEAVADRGRLEARALADYGDARVFRFDHIASVRGTQPRTPIIAAEPQQQPKSVSLFAQQPNDQGVLSGSGSRIQALLKGRKPERLAVPVARVVDAPAAEGTPSQVATERQANRVRRGTSLDLRGISGTAGVPGDTAQRAPTDESVETTTAAQRPAAIVAEEAASAKGASTLGTSTSTASTWNNLFGDSS
ncbi:MAG: DUF4384 domain-containing protein, partial [Chromatiales bacterium]|nr:DUF4384 domain-containing protein [Chromatiales bacterium]